MRRAPSLPDDALRAAYDAHGAELYRFARRSLGDAGLAEDAVQEAFLRAWRASASYDPARASQRTWLFAILRNVVIDLVRARRRPAHRWRPAATPTEGAADDELDRALTSWQVETALAELDDDHRRVLVEVHWRGRPYAEVARRPRHPGGHREEPRVLRPARHAHARSRPRGGEMAERPLGVRGVAAGARRLAGGPAPARRGGGPRSRTSTPARPAGRRPTASCTSPPSRSAPTPGRAAAEPPPADLGDRIVARVARERRARRAGRLARGDERRRGGGRRRRVGDAGHR